jgi:hypothetical protein
MPRNCRERRWNFLAQLETLEPRWLMSSDLSGGDSFADVSLQGSALGALTAPVEPGATIALPDGASMTNPTFGSTFRSNLGGGVGYWDASSSWSEGRAPTANDRVIVATGDTLIIRDTSAITHSITVHEGGKLVFATDVNTELKVITLVVLGELEMGTATNPIAANVTANLVIRDVPIDDVADPGQWGNGLVVLGKIRVHGAVKDVSDNRLAVEPRVGHTTLTFERDVTGWKAGDKIFLPGTRQLSHYQLTVLGLPLGWENLTIASVSGNVVTLTTPLTYDHLGARNHTGAIEFMPVVQNLTRNAVIRSESATGTRGHTIFMGRADVDIRYAKFGGLGRTKLGDSMIGRYAVHFHHLYGPTTPQANGYQYTFIGNAVTCPIDPMPFKWAVTIHDSHFGLIQNNDINNWAGAGIVTEDGSETQNVIEGNRVMRILGSGVRIDDMGEAGDGYWFHGPDNHVRNNVAANIQRGDDPYSYGFKVFGRGLGTVRVPAFQGADKTEPGQSVSVNMNLQPLREFRSNEVFASANGLTLWWLGTDWETPGDVESQLKDMKIWNTFNWGMFLYECNRLTIDNLTYISTYAPEPLDAIYFGDYMNRQFVLQNSRIEKGAISLPTHTDVRNTTDPNSGRVTIRNTVMVGRGIGGYPPSSVNGSSDLSRRVVLVDNVRFIDTPTTLWLADTGPGTLGTPNFNVDNYMVVTNYNGVAGDNFVVQAPYRTGTGTQLPARSGIDGKIYASADSTPPHAEQHCRVGHHRVTSRHRLDHQRERRLSGALRGDDRLRRIGYPRRIRH